jgi:hypothetical protein
MAGQKNENIEFFRSQFQIPATQGCGARWEINAEVAEHPQFTFSSFRSGGTLLRCMIGSSS